MGEPADRFYRGKEKTMLIIACVDEKNGMMFNHRRQSRDSAVCQDILQECRGKKLYMSAYSQKMFSEMQGTKTRSLENGVDIQVQEIKSKALDDILDTAQIETEIRISDNILKQAGEADACFIEDTRLSGFEDCIQAVILYKWNRKYPADLFFTIDLSDGSWELRQTEEFKGSSHERITKEVYERIR